MGINTINNTIMKTITDLYMNSVNFLEVNEVSVGQN